MTYKDLTHIANTADDLVMHGAKSPADMVLT